MAWDRRGDHAYYKHSQRCGDRVKHIYFGSGPRGQMAEFLALAARADRAAAMEAVRQYKLSFGSVDGLSKELDGACWRLTQASFLAAGFWRSTSRKSRWRRRKGLLAVPADLRPREQAEANLGALVKGAMQGDDDAVVELRAELETNLEHWKGPGDLACRCERAWIELIAGRDDVAREALTGTLKAIKDELAGPSPTHLQRLLVARVAVSWMACCHAAASYAESGHCSLGQVTHALRRMDVAHRRHLAAIRELATVRSMLAPDSRSARARQSSPEPSRAEAPARRLRVFTGEEVSASAAPEAARNMAVPAPGQRAPWKGREHRTTST